ncbi:hypothetical protein JCM10212_002096 [Sporobolomyces blumeae]
MTVELSVKTDFPSSYSGVVEIDVNVVEPTLKIKINAASPLKLLAAVVVSGGARSPATSVDYDEKEGTADLNFADGIASGTAVLVLRWQGEFEAGKMTGYYRVSEPDSDFYAVTQFQPVSARNAFLSLSNAKATFEVSLICPAGYDALSNMPETARRTCPGGFEATALATQAFMNGIEGRLDDDATSTDETEKEWQVVEFKVSPRMSTYLVAWAVGKFESIASSYVSPITNETVPLRIFGAKSQGHIAKGQGQLALDTLAASMPLYEQFFNIPYELGNLDLLVVDEFDAGAMENWGLTTGRKDNLLHDARTSGAAAMRAVVETVAHEAAHQWFGNLCTLSSWDELWLNESFATLVGEVLIVNKLYPDWNVHSAFLKFHRSPALQLDSLRSSHPVKMACGDESEVSQSFDVICYQKGCAVLKMLMSVIGEERFLAGTAAYLKANAYECATSQDLWNALSEASGVDVQALLDAWINKVGFPVVTVEEVANELRVRQNRFLASGDLEPYEDETLWTIPLTIKTIGSQDAPQLVMFSSRELSIPKPNGLYLLNAETAGTYRVAYPPAHLLRLAQEASSGSGLSLLDRVGLVQDVVVLSEAGYLSTTTALSLFKTLGDKESQFLVWTEIADAFREMLDAWWEQPEGVVDALRSFARSLFEPLAKRLGYEHRDNEDPTTKRFRTMVISALAAAEHAETLAWVQASFGKMLAGQMSPSAADSALTIVSTAVRHGTSREYQVALGLYGNAPTPQHKMAAIAGLTGSSDVELLRQTAGMLATGQVVPEDMSKFLYGLARNPRSRRMVWGFVQQAWPVLEQQFRGSMLLGRIASAAFESFSTDTDADAVEAFFSKKETAAFQQPLDQGIEAIRSKVRWLARETDNVQRWLKQEGLFTE